MSSRCPRAARRAAPPLRSVSALALVLSGCATSSRMGLEAPGGWCPRRSGAAPVSGIADREQAPAVAWIGPTEPADEERLGAWCEVVGPPVVAADPDSMFFFHADWTDVGPEGPAPRSDLTVVAWNTWIGGGDLDAFLAQELGVRCSEGGPTLADGYDPFILLLQEVHRRSALVPDVPPDAPVPWLIDPDRPPYMEEGIVGVAGRCGLALAYVPSARNGWQGEGDLSEDKGNAILSSLPLHQVTAIELPFEAGRKVAVAAFVEIPGEAGSLRIDLASVHFDVASTLFRTLMSGNQTRQRQALGLLEGMELGGFTGRAAVVGGDFNTWSSRDGSLKLLSQALPDSPPVSWKGTRGPFPTDHLFFRRDPEGRIQLVEGSYALLPDSHGSDHHPRVFRLRFGHSPR